MAINFGEEMRDLLNNALAEGFPCFLGTASKDGVPQISMKGSVAYSTTTPCAIGSVRSVPRWKTSAKTPTW